MERDYAKLIEALRGFDVCQSCPCETPEMCNENDCMVLQAADAIEELLAEINELKDSVKYAEHNFDLACDHVEELQAAVPKWISVSENQKCPVKAWSCLIGYFNGGIYNQLWWFDFAHTDQNGFIFPSNTDIEGRCVAVFALPEPPKEE